MKKKAIIFDLDNTIYPVSSIGDKLFKALFALINESGEYTGDFNKIKLEIMRRPFQHVADEFFFSKILKSDGLNLLTNITYIEKIEPFKGYETVRSLSCRKFLVTTGFTKLQRSKIEQLDIENDFDQIFVIDPNRSELTKKDIFTKIMAENNFYPEDLLVVGDDLNSEIKAARELRIETVLYDYESKYAEIEDQNVIVNLTDLELYI